MMGQGVACAWHVHVHGVRMCIPRVDVEALAVRLAQVQPLLRKVERRVAALVEHVLGHLAREPHLAGEQRLREARAGVELVSRLSVYWLWPPYRLCLHARVAEENARGEELGEDAAERPDVHFLVVRQAQDDLGRTVRARLYVGRVGVAHETARAEVDHLRSRAALDGAARGRRGGGEGAAAGRRGGGGGAGLRRRGVRGWVSGLYSGLRRWVLGDDGWVVGSHLDDAAGERLDQHVLRLEVAVDQVERMDVRQRSEALVRNRADARQSEVGRPVGLRNVLVQLVQVVAQKLAHDEEVLLAARGGQCVSTYRKGSGVEQASRVSQ